MTQINRRSLLKAAGAAGLSVTLLARQAFAASEGAQAGKKLIVIICRGGMDGLSVSPPVGDANYAALRGGIAIPADQALKLDDTFALHPMLTSVHALAGKGQARVAPAVATPDRARSHFEAQDVLETGAPGVYATTSGWLNRSLSALAPQRKVEALSVGATAPLILRGPVQAASWSPGGSINAQARLPTLLQDLYKHDPLLGPSFAAGLETQTMAQLAMSGLAPPPAAAMQKVSLQQQPSGGPPAPPTPAQAIAAQRQGQEAARKLGASLAGFMTQPNGPQIAALSLDGFDTHANQGAAQGQLANRLAYLDAVLEGVSTGLGPAWKDTVVVVSTEFGRTAHVNGTNGTDHGTGSTALLLGGALKSGGIVGDWPTLQQAALFENRDTAPATDMRALFKGVLQDHMGVDRRALDETVFPESRTVAPLTNLV